MKAWFVFLGVITTFLTLLRWYYGLKILILFPTFPCFNPNISLTPVDTESMSATQYFKSSWMMAFHIVWFRNCLKDLMCDLFLAEKYLVTCFFKFITHWPIDRKVCSRFQTNLSKHIIFRTEFVSVHDELGSGAPANTIGYSPSPEANSFWSSHMTPHLFY
jgi:hypothetical protein